MNRALICVAFLAAASTASTQGLPPEEQYNIRVEYLQWRPSLEAELQAGVFGSRIDLKQDLAIEDERTWEIRGALQIAPGFKVRGSMTPLDYAADTRITGSFVFDGRIYPVDSRVVSSVKGRLYAAGLEFDFLKTRAGYFGVVLGGQMFDGDASITAPELQIDESENLSTPVPFIGASGRIYTGKMSFEGELLGVTVGSRGHFYELRLGARFHVSERIAVGGGYRLFKILGEDAPDFVRFREGGVTFGAELSL